MKKRIVLTVALALVCCGEASASSPYNLRVREINSGEEEVCINLGRRNGRHTFTVPKDQVGWFTRPRGGTARGACERASTKQLSRNQKRVTAYCYNFGTRRRSDHHTINAPRVARRWLKKRGADRGACKGRRTGPDVGMKLGQAREEVDATIIGHRWQALELWDEDTGQLEPAIMGRRSYPNLYFESATNVYGSTGCNNCKGSLLLFTDTQFRISWLATTKMMCHPNTLQQEIAFVQLMSNTTFYYEVTVDTSGQQILLLYETVTGAGEEEIRGDLMARFVRITSF